MVGLLVFGFAGILIAHALATGRLATGQTAFTGLWLLSAITLLVGYPESWRYLTWGGVSLMLGVHAAYLVGSLAMRPRVARPPTIEAPSRPLAAAIRATYWSGTALALVGVTMLIVITGAWQLLFGVSVATLRYVLFDPESIPTLPRILSNFLLVPAALAPAMCVISGARRPVFRYYALAFVCLIGQSVAFGGRGSVTFGGLLLVWGFLTARSQGYFGRLDRRTLGIVGGIVLAILVYQQGIFAGRREVGSEGGFGDYIGLPLPAGCEVLAQNPDQPTLAFGFNSLAPVREGLRSVGIDQERRVDNIAVEVPVLYNVFTYVFEDVQAFGYVGVIVMAFLLGVVGGRLENVKQTLVTLAGRSLLYNYLGMSLFADLAFFYTGWTLAVVLVAFGIPLLERLASPLRRPEPTHP